MSENPTPPRYTAQAQELKDKLLLLKDLIPVGSPIFYFDYAVYSNVGDLLIHYATQKFLEDHGYAIRSWTSHQNLTQRTLDSITDDATIVFQGGGNFGDLYSLHQDMRLRVLSAKPNVRSVILPQSIYFTDEAKTRETARIFARCRDLHFVTRDRVSLAFAQKRFSANLYCLPDIVHYLFQADRPAPTAGGTLYFVRRDHFRSPDQDPAVQHLLADAQEADFVDWSDFLSRSDKRIFRLADRLHRLDRLAGNRMPVHAGWLIYRDRLVDRALSFFARHDGLITNRLHGLLLGLLSGHRISVFDTQYGKLTSYYESWLSDFPDLDLVGAPIHEGYMT